MRAAIRYSLQLLVLLVALSAAAMGFSGLIGALALATEAGNQDFARRTIERRAVEAVIWGMPAVNTDLMLQAMIGSAKGKPNQIVSE
jgi:hypothetical protein